MMRAALSVLQRHVSARYNALAIMDLSLSERHHRQAISYLVSGLGARVAVQLLRDAVIEEPRDHILFVVDSARAFRALRFHFATSLFDREFNFLIVLTRRAGSREAALRDIFATCLSFHVLNAVVLLEQLDGVVLLYGYRLCAPDCRHAFTPELLNRYEDGAFVVGASQQRLFPRPVGSLYGCPLNVSWAPMPPFVIFEGNASDPAQRRQLSRLSGVDGVLLKKLAEIYAFRINLLPPCEHTRYMDDSRRALQAFGILTSAEDCFAQLSATNSSVAIGALSASHFSHRALFSTTSSYHQSALVFVVRVEHIMGSVSQLVQPFCGSVWCALALSCLLAVLLQWQDSRRTLRRRRFDAAACALRVHTSVLGNPLEAAGLPHSLLCRCLLGVWLLLALVLRVAYQGKLYDVFRLPYYPAVPERIADLLSGDYMYLAPDYADYFPVNRTLLRDHSFLTRFAELEAAPAGSRLTTVTLLDNLAHYNQLNWQSSRLTHVKEHIYMYQLVMYLRRHSVLKFAFDRKLKQLQAAGIVSYVNRYFEQRLVHAPYTQFTHEVVPIRLELFCGLYSVCFVMLLFAGLVFLLELLSPHVRWLQRYFL
ncbi:hypothetical protein KR093_003390 [Drosophila rubida]|uniref:Putative ionotropic receptor ligand binding domain-containing protein n=1 Tax=Drosophila rubida TaxID=30044 RepID=A0AAD4PRG3_9MUSC|nr:hypothetical protein KR093_003390 [Drosophila rubida]